MSPLPALHKSPAPSAGADIIRPPGVSYPPVHPLLSVGAHSVRPPVKAPKPPFPSRNRRDDIPAARSAQIACAFRRGGYHPPAGRILSPRASASFRRGAQRAPAGQSSQSRHSQVETGGMISPLPVLHKSSASSAGADIIRPPGAHCAPLRLVSFSVARGLRASFNSARPG